MDRELLVYMDIAGAPVLVGRLWVRVRRGRETATFTYDEEWLAHPGSFALSPELQLAPGAFHSDGSLFKVFKDAAPDRWGQKLMRHYERNRAAANGTQPRTLLTADFLIGVNDETRLGALRFKETEQDAFLSQSENPVPLLIELRHLLSATDRLDRGRARRGDLELVLVPGGSLGGARPKAVIRDRDGSLCMAKFPKADDDWSVIKWEAVTLQLAHDAGISVPQWRTERIGQRIVLLTRRFDREGDAIRYPFMSMMTALDAEDHEERSYLEIVDAIRMMGGRPNEDLSELWRRLVFNVLVCNTDDHLRNHAFLRSPDGWCLSPAYDMNPCPIDVNARFHALAINEIDRQASLEIALGTTEYFGLSAREATEIAGDVAASVTNWRDVATRSGIERHEIDRMASAFDHGDVEDAISRKASLRLVKKAAKAKKKTPARKKSAAKRKVPAKPKSARTPRKPPKGKKSRP